MYNKGKGVMHTICTIPEKNVLECNSEERTKEWKITNRLDFNALGIINTRTFHTKDIVAKKYYEVSFTFYELVLQGLSNYKVRG